MVAQRTISHAASVSALVLMSKEDIKKDQDGIKRDVTKTAMRIHNNAIQCLLHAEKHGDTSLLTRLIIDVLGRKSGFNDAGLTQWARKHSPIELKGKVITLSGVIEDDNQRATLIKAFPEVDKDLFIVGNKRPFLVAEADAHPFWTDAANASRTVRPLFQQTITGVFTNKIREFKQAAENTVNGKPVDASKPFYDGRDVDLVADVFDKIEAEMKRLPKDMTREIRKASEELKRLQTIEGTDPSPPDHEDEHKAA